MKNIAFNIIDSTSVQATRIGAYGTIISIFGPFSPCQCFNHILFFPPMLKKKKESAISVGRFWGKN